ncbi:hypothetical protein I7I51_05852 [Histoplasma capsulatum]|uniref:Uncharacterized protein n=1 Tax=Ajellomyces capsulatus TaxID=5037 RepID=A0A8A1M8V2_AJECA|nr:hypothetical protein I7I51_05852 [Histoplasma capsulatum]
MKRWIVSAAAAVRLHCGGIGEQQLSRTHEQIGTVEPAEKISSRADALWFAFPTDDIKDQEDPTSLERLWLWRTDPAPGEARGPKMARPFARCGQAFAEESGSGGSGGSIRQDSFFV